MKIGIVVYSQTGNTYSVAERLKEKLGGDTTIEKIEVEGEIRFGKEIEFKHLPKINKYDLIIFASPVQGFSLSMPMKSYLNQIETLKNKKIICFVTEGFRYPWMGGNHAIRQMKKICESKEGHVIDSGIINWGNKRREQMIEDLINKFSIVK